MTEMKVKSIPTEYNGIKYRSRLEARWAMFFELCKVGVEYEEHSFTLTDGTRYVPDFYIPSLDMYAEVKGADEYLSECLPKMCLFVENTQKNLLVLGNMEMPKDKFECTTMPIYSALVPKQEILKLHKEFEDVELDSFVSCIERFNKPVENTSAYSVGFCFDPCYDTFFKYGLYREKVSTHPTDDFCCLDYGIVEGYFRTCNSHTFEQAFYKDNHNG